MLCSSRYSKFIKFLKQITYIYLCVCVCARAFSNKCRKEEKGAKLVSRVYNLTLGPFRQVQILRKTSGLSVAGTLAGRVNRMRAQANWLLLTATVFTTIWPLSWQSGRWGNIALAWCYTENTLAPIFNSFIHLYRITNQQQSQHNYLS